MMDPKTFSASTLVLLQEDPRRYRNFGVYWFFVKALMKHFYTADNLHLLGDYVDDDVIAAMPAFESLQDALVAAADEYRQNASFNLGSSQVDDQDGGVITLLDEDAGL